MVAEERTVPRPRLTRVITGSDELRADLRAVAARKVWFGHHSVGSDVLEGVASLVREEAIDLVISEGPLGENGKPLEKFRDFERESITSDAELVLMKLCYADFTPASDAPALVDAYVAAVARIRAARPGIRIVHVTPPLTAREVDSWARLSRALGRPVWGDGANLRRLEFAEGVAMHFPGEPLFDLGLLESTRDDGVREIHSVAGVGGARMVPFLWSGWSRDGGHLNDDGKRMAARALLRTLAAAFTHQGAGR